MTSFELTIGDSVLCPKGMGEAILIEKGVKIDPREPYDPDLCKVRLKRRNPNPVRYFYYWELTKVDVSNIPDENANCREKE